MTDPNDPRWDGRAPWFLRYQNFAIRGNVSALFDRLSQRLYRLMYFNEAELPNTSHFASQLETESGQLFRTSHNSTASSLLQTYFRKDSVEQEIARRLIEIRDQWVFDFREKNPTSEKASSERAILAEWKTVEAEQRLATATRVIQERIEVLEASLRLLPRSALPPLVRDLRRAFAETEMMLDIRMEADTPLIVPMEEPLLREAVIDQLLPRLAEKFPDRARELVDAYHGMLRGDNEDTVFLNAFKSLEEIARGLTGDSAFVFDKKCLARYFAGLHGTIQETLVRLAAHRGDKGGHGKDAPPPHEIRYLLFAICNTALLLLDYPSNATSR